MRRWAFLAGVAVVSVVVTGTASRASSVQSRWVIRDLGPGVAVGVNESGQVIGGGAWIWQDGKTTQLGTLGGRERASRRSTTAAR